MAGTPRSCTSCRQAKVGCDARKKPSNTPCSRCTKHQLECRFDKNFKRILTRKLTASLTNELHQLRMSQTTFDGGSQQLAAGIQLREPELLRGRGPFFFTNVAEPLSDFTTGNVTIPPGTIIELIQHFGDQYHGNAHFVQPIESLADFHATSPLLFWTIILISSHFHPRHSGLFERLLLPHEELLRPFTNTAIQSIHEIHALLLLCLWPTPKRQQWSSPTWNYIGLAVGACMRLDLDKTGPRANNLGGELRPEGISVQTRKMTWLACLAISTQEATFLGLLPPLSSRPHIKHSRRAMDELGAHLRPGFRPKFAVYELMCNFCLVLEEVDGAAAQLSLAETFDGSLSALHRAYAAEWAADVDVLLQYARLMLHATALMRILVEDATTATTAATVTTATATATATANAAVPSERLADVQVLIIRGAEASERLIAGFRAMIDEASGATTPGDGCGGMEGRPSMPTCYPRYYFEMAFFAAVFTFRTAYMRPSPDRAAAVRGLVEVYNIYRLFPAHPDIVIGADAVHHVLRCAGSGDLPYASAPLGSLVTTNRLGASFVWDTITGLIQLFGGGDEKFLTMKAALSSGGGGERQPQQQQQQQQRQEEGVTVAATASSSASSSRVSSIDDIVSIDSSAAAAVMHDANSIAAMHHHHHQHVPEAVTAAAAGGLPLPISLDWGDIDMSLLTFDVFGLEAGEHIAW